MYSMSLSRSLIDKLIEYMELDSGNTVWKEELAAIKMQQLEAFGFFLLIFNV